VLLGWNVLHSVKWEREDGTWCGGGEDGGRILRLGSSLCRSHGPVTLPSGIRGCVCFNGTSVTQHGVTCRFSNPGLPNMESRRLFLARLNGRIISRTGDDNDELDSRLLALVDSTYQLEKTQTLMSRVGGGRVRAGQVGL
jgi:hypothetical protein